MFHDIPQSILDRMRYLEGIDSRDRSDCTPRAIRLRQIPPKTGRFIALLAATAPEGSYIEIGTSAGYSTLWLSLACRHVRRKITTFEVLAQKAELARETFRAAGVEDVVQLIHGDALEHVPNCRNIAFCFVDAEKELYLACYEAVVPNMVHGGLLVADNAISHEAELRQMLNRAISDDRVDAIIVPIEKGVLVCRRI